MKNNWKRKGRQLLAPFFVIALAFLMQGCETEPINGTVPNVPVREEINLRSPAYFDLNVKCWAYLDNVGVRGIILVKDNDGFTYRAFERYCPYKPENSDCGLIEVNPLGVNLGFVDNCIDCRSTFSRENGAPISGPAELRMLEYQVTVLREGYILITNPRFN